MKRITKEELPEILTDDIINILVEMALEDPKLTFDWANVSDLLEERGQLRVILDKVRAIKKSSEQAKENAKSEEQKRLEAEHNKKAEELGRLFLRKMDIILFKATWVNLKHQKNSKLNTECGLQVMIKMVIRFKWFPKNSDGSKMACQNIYLCR
ncbi:hypothetical protein [Niabella ginsengisoli]|uniref:Uncharacterized protein n=1 Tax=Niabella ginsengisoli TaxID=522298 RepID=A0ABS9SI05_9BACT|nr:hypothetical protein [Niabella ginsengisoli]MCH5597975.1 hypothetical protein [Niabella ginsengisoli]